MESIKISKEAKRMLEVLQAKITLETGKKVKLSELLELSVQMAMEREEELKRRLAWRPVKNAKAILDELSFEGPESASEEIDEVLY